MRYIFIFFFYSLFCTLIAQKHDYYWKTGYASYPTGTLNGGVDINFNLTPPDTSYVYRDLDFNFNSATICNAYGDFLFSSNGCGIYGADDQLLQNGDTLNPGYYHEEFCITDIGIGAYPTVQDIFFIPHPADTNLYYLIHPRVGYEFTPQGTGHGINEFVSYSLLDKRLDGGRGGVVAKNVEVLHDTMSLSSLAAVRHGNGEDWWIITNEHTSNKYIFFRLDADGIQESHRQAVGVIDREDGAAGQNNFSPDGNWFARFGGFNGLVLYRFNRCEGTLHDPLYEEVPMVGDSSTATGGVAFSPDSRLLYRVSNLWIDQYDLYADDIIASRQRVATWDGVIVQPENVGAFFFLPQLGPDGRIYICPTNNIPYLHVIEYPNERGYACQVNQRGFPLPSRSSLTIPYFPNYRLGALGPGGCDSLPTRNLAGPVRPAERLTVYPNPARAAFTVTFPTPPRPGDVLLLRDGAGRELRRQAAGVPRFETPDWPAGLYLVEWRRGGRLLARGRVVLQ